MIVQSSGLALEEELIGAYEAIFYSVHHKRCGIVDTELLHDVLAVRVHGVSAKEQSLRYFHVRVALGYQNDNFQFSIAQLNGVTRSGAVCIIEIDAVFLDAVQYLTAEKGRSLGRFFQRLHDFLDAAVLFNVAIDPGT